MKVSLSGAPYSTDFELLKKVRVNSACTVSFVSLLSWTFCQTLTPEKKSKKKP